MKITKNTLDCIVAVWYILHIIAGLIMVCLKVTACPAGLIVPLTIL